MKKNASNWLQVRWITRFLASTYSSLWKIKTTFNHWNSSKLKFSNECCAFTRIFAHLVTFHSFCLPEGTKNKVIQTMLRLLEIIKLQYSLHLLLGALAVWLTNPSGRSDFFDASGHVATMKLVEQKEDMALLESCAKLAAAACVCHEGNKCRC